MALDSKVLGIGIAFLVIGLAVGFLAGGAMHEGEATPAAENATAAPQVPPVCSNLDLLDKIKEEGVLIVGTSADWPPYEYVVPGTGGEPQYAGIDIRLAEEIAKALGVQLKIEDMKFAALFQAVQSGKVHIVIADVAMKPNRLEAVDFTIPYRCESGKAIIVRAEDAPAYAEQGKDWLKGKKIGVQAATVEEELAKKYFGSSSEIVAYDRVYPEMTMALKNGKIDAMIVAPDVAKVVVSMTDGIKIVDHIPYFGCSAVVVPHCAYSLKQAISQVIWDLQQSGKLDQIIQEEMQKWLESQQAGSG